MDAPAVPSILEMLHVSSLEFAKIYTHGIIRGNNVLDIDSTNDSLYRTLLERNELDQTSHATGFAYQHRRGGITAE